MLPLVPSPYTHQLLLILVLDLLPHRYHRYRPVWKCKHDELIDFCNTYHPDVLFLCETWPTPNQQVNIPSYSCYRRDRPVHDNPHNRDPTRGYGGVAVLLRNGVFGNIWLLDIPWFPSTGFEAVAVSATVLKPSHTTQRAYTENESISFVCIYRPPVYRQEQQTRFLQNFHVTIQRLLNDTSATVVVIMTHQLQWL